MTQIQESLMCDEILEPSICTPEAEESYKMAVTTCHNVSLNFFNKINSIVFEI